MALHNEMRSWKLKPSIATVVTRLVAPARRSSARR
jgi:hypothetical protein